MVISSDWTDTAQDGEGASPPLHSLSSSSHHAGDGAHAWRTNTPAPSPRTVQAECHCGSRPSRASSAMTCPILLASRNPAGGRPYPGSPGRWWSMTTAPAGIAGPSHSTAYTTAPSGSGDDSATTRYALPGCTRWPVSSSAWTTCSPALASRSSIRCISGSGAPRIHTLCRVSSSVARRAQRAGRARQLIDVPRAGDPPLGGAGGLNLVRHGRQCGVRRLHRLTQRARCALRDAVLVAAVVADDVAPAAPGPLDFRLPGAGPAHTARRVPAGGLDGAAVERVPAAAVASVAA